MLYLGEQTDRHIIELVALESKRLTEKYNKDFLDCDDLMKITNLGKDNVRAMMHSKGFPLLKVGKRCVVNVSSFADWQIRNTFREV